MASQNREVVVNIISDASKFLKGYEQAIEELEKYSKKADIASGMQQQIDALKNDVKEMSVALQHMSTGKIDTKQIDNLGAKLEKQIERIDYLYKTNKEIKIKVDETSGNKFDAILSNANTLLDQLNVKVQMLNNLGININTDSVKTTNERIHSLNLELASLKRTRDILKNDNSFAFDNLNSESAIKELKRLQSEYITLDKQMETLDGTEFENAAVKLGILSKQMLQLRTDFSIDSTKGFKLIDTEILKSNIQEAIDINATKGKEVQESIKTLKNSLTEVINVQFQDGKLTVPLEVETNIDKLKQQATELIQQVQTAIWETPLMVPLKFTSSYITKAQDELKGLEQTINSMGNSKNKAALVSQLDNLKKQLKERDFRIEFKTNITELETDINKGLKTIQKSLKDARLYLYPEVVIDEESKTKIQNTLNEISQSLQLDLSQLGLNINKLLGDEDRKKIQESLKDIKIEITPSIKLTDKDINDINKKLTQQLAKLKVEIDTTELQKGLAKALDSTLIDKWGNKFISTIDAVCRKIDDSFGQLSQNQFYEAMKGWATADSIQRENRVGRVSNEGRIDTTKESTAYGELERFALVNSKTNKVFGNYLVDQAHSVSGAVQRALKDLASSLGKSASEFYDTVIHSHPVAKNIEYNGTQYQGIGSNLTFSGADLQSYQMELKNGFKKMMVESNGMIRELDLSTVDDRIVNAIVQEYKKKIKTIDWSQTWYTKNGKNYSDYSMRSDLSKDLLSSIIASKGLDVSQHLKDYSIESLKVTPENVKQNNEEISQLIQLLNQMSTSLTEINKKNFKLDTKSIDSISKKLESLLVVLKELNTQVHSFDFSNINVSVEPIEKITDALTNLSNMFQRAFNVASDTDISNQWSKLQEQFNSFAKADGNFDSRKKEVVELIKEYQKYLDMGGKNPITDLTSNKKGQDKLTSQYNKYIESQKKAAQESAKAIETENKALEKTEKTAKKSAQSKEEFTKANQSVKKSAEQSAESIKEEVKEIQNVENVINDNKDVTPTTSSSSTTSATSNDISITSSTVNQVKKEQDIIEETGLVATNTAKLVKQAEDVKQQEYKETANALEVLKKAQVGTADIFEKTQAGFDFTDPHLEAKRFFEEYANSIAQAEGLSESKYTINTDANQNFKYATIEYYNEALKQTITETWKWHEANQKIEGDTDRMVVSNIKFVDNVKARYEQQKKDNETMSKALQKANEALTSFDSKTQSKLKSNEKYKELSELLSNGFKNLDDVKRAQKLMNELNVELNNINADARRGSASFDIFSNMVKGINEADQKVQLLTVDYQSLTNVSDDVTQKFKKLQQSLSTLKNAQGVENQAKAYGDYREALNEATYAIRIFKKEQSLINNTTVSYQKDTLLSEDVNTQKLQLDKLQQSLKFSGLLTDELKLKFDKLYSELEQVDSAYSNNLWKKSFQQLKLDVSSTTEIEKERGNLESLYKQLSDIGLLTDTLAQKINDLSVSLGSVKTNEDLTNWISQFNNLKSLLPDETVNYFKDINNQINQIMSNTNVNYTGYESQFTKLNQLLNEYKVTLGLVDQSDDMVWIDGQKDAATYKKEIQSILSYLKQLPSLQKSGWVLDTKNTSQITNIDQVTERIKELAKEQQYGKQIGEQYSKSGQEVTLIFRNQDGIITKVRGKVDELSKSMQTLTTQSNGAIGLFGNFSKTLKQTANQLATFYLSAYAFIRYFREGINIVKEFDAAMTELIKVSNDAESVLFKFEKEAFNIANTIGSTGKEIINSAADWERLGYAINDASELAKNSALYSNVGDMDIDTATEHMISTLKAFNIEAQNSIVVVDKFNEIGNNYAITSEGIGSALERSAASLVAAGNSLDESIALITAGNIISQNAESVGNAIKVLSLRIRGSKSELEEMGEETDNLASSTSKLREEILGLTGVDIMLDDSTYKSTYQIILEISKVWDKLSDVSQAATLEKLAGKTRASVVAGLLQQGETLEAVFNDASKAEGSALKENQKYLESVQGHLDKLTNKWQEVWTEAFSRDAINFFVDLGTKILDVVDFIGLIPTAMAAAFGALSFKTLLNKNGGGRAKKKELSK